MDRIVRKKGQRTKLAREIHFWITEQKYQELNQMLASSDYGYMNELLRDILDNKVLRLAHRDASIDSAMLTFGEYLKYLQQLEINMEQITQKVMALCTTQGLDAYEQKIIAYLEDYKPLLQEVGDFINETGVKWLQK